MIKGFKWLMLWITFIGLISLSLSTTLGQNITSFISATYYNGIKIYQFDMLGYVNSLLSVGENVHLLQVEIPTKDFSSDTTWAALINNLGCILNILIYVVNILIMWPLRLISYAITLGFALMGLNATTTSPLYWLIELLNNITAWQIPYIA